MDIFLPVAIVGGLGLVFGIVLAVASAVMEVKVDEKVSQLLEVLPGANCGGCGYSGCEAYATAIAKGEAKTTLCAPGGNEVSDKLDIIMGNADSGEIEPKRAVVLCGGTTDKARKKFIYEGVRTCEAARRQYSGMGSCAYGCLGFGDCQRSCVFDAIRVINGVARIDRNRCTGCGVCVRVCPAGIISLLPQGARTIVLCSSHDNGAETRKNCKVGCIACGRCVKACQYDAITVKNKLAIIDQEKCVNCGACARVCPTQCIYHEEEVVLEAAK